MVLTMKLTSFAYNLYDGTADRKAVFADYDDKKKVKLYTDRKYVPLPTLSFNSIVYLQHALHYSL